MSDNKPEQKPAQGKFAADGEALDKTIDNENLATDPAAQQQAQAVATKTQAESEKEIKINALASDFAEILGMVVGLVGKALPSVKALYDDKTIGVLALSTAAVCVKRHWLENGFKGAYAEELALACVVVPIGMATFEAVKTDLAVLKAKPVTDSKPAE